MRKTPQEKKSLSYQKDGRNQYRQNDKASRKILPRKKKLASQAYRRRANAPLAQVHVASDTEAEILIEPCLGLSPFKRKVRDQPLADHVINQLYRRARKGMITEEAFDETEERIRERANPKSRQV